MIIEDKKYALKVLKKDGLYLKNVTEKLTVDKEVVLEAVIQNGLALQYASEILKKDKDVVLIAIRNHVLSIEYASLEIQGLLNNHRGIADVLESLINKEKFEKQLFKTKNANKKKIKI